jgi:hypothetical protein
MIKLLCLKIGIKMEKKTEKMKISQDERHR